MSTAVRTVRRVSTAASRQIYAESFVDQAHLDTIVAEARAIVERAMGSSA